MAMMNYESLDLIARVIYLLGRFVRQTHVGKPNLKSAFAEAAGVTVQNAPSPQTFSTGDCPDGWHEEGGVCIPNFY